MNALRLASASPTRRAMLEAAGLKVEVMPARVDEAALTAAMQAEGARPRDIADALAEMKARKVGSLRPDGLTLGADQVLDLGGRALGKPETPDDAAAMLRQMSGQVHVLHSAAVVYAEGAPVWRHVAPARMRMRSLSPGYIDAYVARNWDAIRQSAGGYLIEGEGIRLFATIAADYHAILGLPLMQLIAWLVERGEIET